MDELEALALANIALPQTDRSGELDTLARLDRYGRFDIGGPLKGRVGTLDRVYDFMPWRSLERFKAAAKPTITPDLMGGVKVGITDPYGVALEATDLLGLGLDVGDIARVGRRAVAPAARRVESMLLAPRTPMTSQFGAVGKKGMLPMDEANRLRRADEMFPTRAYHGTTHDITEFDGFKANPESDWGPATYTSTSIEDINPNYAGEGPDLTSRLTIRAEQIKDEAAFHDPSLKKKFEEIAGMSWDEMDYDARLNAGKELARKELKGTNEGAVYPLRINTEKYATIGGSKRTIHQGKNYYAQARKELDPKDFADEFEYEDAVIEMAWEDQANDIHGLHQQVYDALMQTDADESELMAAWEEIFELMVDGDLDLTAMDDVLRRKISIVEGTNGEALGGGAVSAKILESLGYEGVIDNTVDVKFGSSRAMGKPLEGVTPDTQHIITFPGYEKNIRSKFAKFDPAKRHSADILAGTAAGALGLSGLLGDQSGN